MKIRIIRILTATGLVLCLSFISGAYIVNPTPEVFESIQPEYDVLALTAADQTLSPISRGTSSRQQEAQAVTEPQKPIVTPDNAQELDLLARLITAEAQAEPYEAKVAVGAVVMNRVKSSDFPNSIDKVIYQNINGYYQFTPVVNGWIDKPAQSDCMEAAKEALNGRDPSNGALFYYDHTSTNSWMLAKPVSTRIGLMIFAY